MSRRSTLEVTIESCPTCSFKPKVEYFVELVKDKLGDAVNVTFTDAPRGKMYVKAGREGDAVYTKKAFGEPKPKQLQHALTDLAKLAGVGETTFSTEEMNKMNDLHASQMKNAPLLPPPHVTVPLAMAAGACLYIFYTYVIKN